MFNNTDCPVVKIDSNLTGLRYAWEYCLKQLPVSADAVAATGTVTMLNAGTVDDTITVGAEVFTLVDDTPANGFEVEIGVSAAATATALAAAIDAMSQVSAAAVGAVVTVTATPDGVEGNSVALAEVGTSASVSGAFLTGGADAVPGPEWRVFEPNSYSDFGSTINTVARNPINPSRQRRKGAVTGVEASGGFNQDLTFNNTTDVMQGFAFALAREKLTTQGLNEAPVDTFVNVTSGTNRYSVDEDHPVGVILDTVGVGDLVYASGFTQAANNGMKRITGSGSAAGNTFVTVAEALVNDATAQPVGAKLTKVGVRATSGDLSIELNGDLVRLVSADQGIPGYDSLIPGEWIFIGGDDSVDRFENNIGFARINVITEDYLEFDKVSWANPVDESGAGKTVKLFFGTVIRNESDPALIRRGTLQLERTLGNDANGVMSEYIIGAVPNELTLNVPQEDKVTVDMTFIGCDAEHRSGTQGVKAGTRPVMEALDALNTSSDFSRIKLSIVDPLTANPSPLFAFATDLTLTINNNASANKAVGTLGAIDITAGTFEVGGSITAYFANIESVQAVRNNADITLDFIMVKENQGLIFDIPLLSLGNGRLAVEQDQAITLPLDTSAAESKFGNTLMFMHFPYLPDAAG